MALLGRSPRFAPHACLSLGGSHLKCKSNAIFWTTWISSMQNKWGITMLVFELFWYNLDMEWQGNPPLSLTKTKWVIICDFISYFMCNVGQHIYLKKKPSMVTPQLFYMYFREYFCSFSSNSYYFNILGVSHLKITCRRPKFYLPRPARTCFRPGRPNPRPVTQGNGRRIGRDKCRSPLLLKLPAKTRGIWLLPTEHW